MASTEAQGDDAGRGQSESESAAGAGGYLLAGHVSELERLQLQSRVWEPSGRRLLEEIGDGNGSRALDVGCGALGWLRILSEWVGPDGEVTGTDLDEAMLRAADGFVAAEGLRNVRSSRTTSSRASSSRTASIWCTRASRSLRWGARPSRWRRTSALRGQVERSCSRIQTRAPGDSSAGTGAGEADRVDHRGVPAERGRLGGGTAAPASPSRIRDRGGRPRRCRGAAPGHPYLGLPLQFATALESRLLALVTEDELDDLRRNAEAELQDEGRWGTTFTLVQCWGRTPA